ncbi:penicillin-binding protein [Bacillus canaveralius]|uniref:serine-type D-Ala-D-Ala carboxypeptidase n=1 Tax=Bacillus canaveralius TaxID=1403243 RepID=A0A2N5GRP3_9BACI|nr:penicillin-binding protein 2 [Bacillus canaveralius]PLR86100.1 penicillin-binding protein [Bacillus canaveralius]PLS00220.1 penicillin-binding protein [Bacillus canaveralius]
MKKKKEKRYLPIRLNLLFFVVFILFSLLILRLGIVQIVYGNDFKQEVDRTENITVQKPVPRGKMYDRHGRIIIDNTPINAITYTKLQGTTPKEMLVTAENLAKLITVGTEKIRERDKQDFWILRNPEKAAGKITKAELQLFKKKKLTDKQLYQLQLDRITEEDLKELSEDDLKVLAIYRELNSGYALTPQIVKNDHVTKEEFALVSENLNAMPGVDTTADWQRKYLYEPTLKSVLGNTTETDDGLPEERIDYFLSRGYSRNDRVGKSYLEMQYEDVLHGHKAKIKNITDKAGNVLGTEVISEGQRGKDLVLTIDMDLQIAVEKIIEEQLWATKQLPHTSLLDRAYVVLIEPKTGEILTMAGKRIVKNEETGQNEMIDDALGNITTTYNVGSAVKGATVLTGFKTGVIKPTDRFDDTPLKFKGTPQEKGSYKYLGKPDDVEALKLSSNVYMFHTAIRIGKGHYRRDMPLPLDIQGFGTIRDSFAQFGLGVRTGIDLPNEQNGFKGMSTLPGHMLDLVIGQYDTYSTMQLAQYVSTIANDGYRLKPHIVKEIREPASNQNELGPVFKKIPTTVLNKLDVQEEWLDRVQLGFQKVMQESGGTGYRTFGTATYLPAGKTGTAQAFYDGPQRKKSDGPPPEVMNLSLVAYAPYNNPEVAMAVIVPWVYQADSGPSPNMEIGRKVLDTYFSLKHRAQQ